MPDPSASTVTALVIARNEGRNLAQCLEALAWADERIVVVDAASIDATEAIARRHADRILVRPFDDFASQRNAGLALARSEWVLSVDADERSSEGQGTEIRRVIDEASAELAGFRVPIRSVVLGRTFRFSGTQLDLPLRLFRRDRGRWTGAVHETVDLQGEHGQLQTPLLHRTIPDMRTFLGKLDAYTTLEARKLQNGGRVPRHGDLTLRPLWTFLKLYLYRQGFRDGAEGLAFCLLSGVSVFVRNWKLRELTWLGPMAPSDTAAERSPQRIGEVPA